MIFFARTTEKIRELNKEHRGNLSCDKRFLCEICSVEFTTSNEKYKMYYKDDTDIYMGEESTLVIGDQFEYNSKGIYIENKNEAVNSNTSETNFSVTDGNDWLQMNDSQKSNTVATIFTSLKSNGYTVLENTNWFVDALNAFYGVDATNGTKITDVITLVGFGGKVITKT
ncbi:hypothetical protein [Bacillus sp. 196mf]|uniref:hypothetical protein n=1 Tax=Bacillus sp. 196mf TaxID=1761754 RepID=UPI000D886FC9|nr:hypothetical protein [Bacillus sp. 196mf]PYE88852.1 hypothetical protein ATL10_10409 [Bacillus sp. 196mf]